MCGKMLQICGMVPKRGKKYAIFGLKCAAWCKNMGHGAKNGRHGAENLWHDAKTCGTVPIVCEMVPKM